MLALKQLVKRSAFYRALNALRIDFRRRQTIREWRGSGGDAPPPPEFKHATIRQYGKRFRCDVLIETGTYIGDTIAAVRNDFSDVYSIELSPELHNRALERFATDPNVHLLLGDSGGLLRRILPSVTCRPLFWLDAHYSEGCTARGAIDTPIVEELKTIMAFCPNSVVLIDDARMFDGTNSYPTLAELKKQVASNAPGWLVELKDDIIRLYARRGER